MHQPCISGMSLPTGIYLHREKSKMQKDFRATTRNRCKLPTPRTPHEHKYHPILLLVIKRWHPMEVSQPTLLGYPAYPSYMYLYISKKKQKRTLCCDQSCIPCSTFFSFFFHQCFFLFSFEFIMYIFSFSSLMLCVVAVFSWINQIIMYISF
jgi:hypothetical protein